MDLWIMPVTKVAFYFLVLLTCANKSTQTSDEDKAEAISTTILSKKIDGLLEDVLKKKEMQAHLDSLPYTSVSLNGEQTLNSLASILQKKFEERVTTVKTLQKKVYDEYGKSSNFYQCCKFPSHSFRYDGRFKSKVATDEVCERIALNPVSSPKKLSSKFVETCVENLKALPSLKWQYFGSEQGLTTIFPANKPGTECYSYDNRFRPWYVQANVPEPKNVVIVIDKSGSMGEKYENEILMDLAKKAAMTVINTLNPFDKFAVLAFSTDPQIISTVSNGAHSCFTTHLAQATPQNKELVSDFVLSIIPGGDTRYGPALNKAFDYFESESSTEFDNVILFMSDGKPTDSSEDILNVLQQRNQLLKKPAVIMTFGLGNLDFAVLRNMSEIKFTDSSKSNPTIVSGVFTAVTNPNNLRTQMGFYYQYFSSRNQSMEEPIWTVPYLDSWGLGQMITASLPVYIAGDLIGVAAVDITLEELFADATYFRPNELSYSFIINEQGLVINHPLLPYNHNDSLFLSATSFERDPEFVSIFESMKRGESGNKKFVSTKILPRGDSKKYGSKQIKVSSTYYWKQIPSTKFSLCLVIADGNSQSQLNLKTSTKPGSFLYNRIDLLPPEHPCTHLKNLATMKKTSVSLAPRAFSDPEYYLTKTFDKTDVEAIVKYMEGSGSNTENLKEQIKPEVVATSYADELWTEHTDLQNQVVWRYIGTRNGVFRSYPGSQWPNNFDPTIRPWYEHAVANRDKNVITSPYKDAASGVMVVTLSNVLFEGKSSGKHDPETDQIAGVMGVDVLLTFFSEMIYKIYPECESKHTKCYLVDHAGFVIVADEYFKSEYNLGEHITVIAQDIAFALIKNGVLLSTDCSIIEGGLTQRTYMIANDQRTTTGFTSGSACYYFELVPVENTNTYLIIMKSHEVCSGVEQSCYCNERLGTCSRSWMKGKCACPCSTSNVDYLPCQNLYRTTLNSSLPCSPENAVLSSVTNTSVDLDSFSVCYQVGGWRASDDDDKDFGWIAWIEPLARVGGFVIFGLIGAVAVGIKYHKQQQIQNRRRAGQNGGFGMNQPGGFQAPNQYGTTTGGFNSNYQSTAFNQSQFNSTGAAVPPPPPPLMYQQASPLSSSFSPPLNSSTPPPPSYNNAMTY